jgi:hypothetical protein
MFTASRTSRRPHRRARLNLTELGAKAVPAVVLTSLDLDGDGATDDVRITGDAGNNKVTITDNGASSVSIQIDANGDGDTIDGADKTQTINFTGDTFVVEAKLAGGNDTFDYVAGATFDSSARTVSVDLGGGNDRFGWATGAFDVNNHSRIALAVTGGTGSDQGSIAFDGVSDSVASVRTDWGAGKDNYTLTFGLIDNGAAVDGATELGDGTNTHVATFAGVGKFDRGTLDVAIGGGAQSDSVIVHLTDDVGDNTSVSRASIAADLRGADDSFGVRFKAGEFLVDNNSVVTVSARGGAGNDSLLAQMEGAAAGAARIDEGAMLSVALDGGLGNDLVAFDVGGSNTWEIRAGGIMQVRLDGGVGTDGLICKLSNNAASVADYDVAVRGGTGSDAVVFGLANPGGAVSFGPANGAIVDGGTGSDVLTDLTPGFALKAGFESVL